MSDVGTLPAFNCKVVEPSQLSVSWNRWLRSFKYYIVGRNVTDVEQKKALLLHFAGPDVQDIFETLKSAAPDEDPKIDDAYDVAVKRLNAYVCPKKNIAYERHVFRKIQQESGEMFDQFLMRLKQQAVYCEFGTVEDEQIRDQVIDYCRSNQLRRKLLEKGNIGLDEVVKIAKASEITEYQVKKFDTSNEFSVARVQTQKKHEFRERPRYHDKKQKVSGKRCYRCNKENHFSKDPNCPARNATCNRCSLKGHFAVCCKTKSKNYKKQVNTVEVSKHDRVESDQFAFHINSCASASCLIDGKVELNLLIDSGASMNIIDKETWNDLKRHKIVCKSWVSNEKLHPYGNSTPLNVLRHFKTLISHNEKSCQAEFIVFDGKGQPLMGLETANELGILNLSVNKVSVEGEVKKPFPKFKGEPIKLHIDHSVVPVSQAPRRVPFSLLKKVETKIQELLDLDIIEEVKGPTTWVSPVVIVNKQDGDIRLCVDMRRPNQAIIREVFQIPVIDEVLEKINGSKWFGKIDLKWGYHQLELAEDS